MDIVFLSKRIYTGDPETEFIEGAVLVTQEGKVRRILKSTEEINSFMYNTQADEVYDFGDKILMPGLIDSHVHINEPGRPDWEGFATATKAAAAGGFTTIVDMPLNSIPSTTSIENLKAKLMVARGKLYVDVAFWGGAVPDNVDDLLPLVRNGVVGFKCFLCNSGVSEFPHLNEEQVEAAMAKLENSGTVLAFHAEVDPAVPIKPNEDEPKKYETFLNTRPPSMELRAVELVSKLAKKYNLRTHIVHLSTAEALPAIRECRAAGGQLTVETCHHYLSLAAEDVPDGRTDFKCTPPIRSRDNQQKLWQAVVDKDIDLVVSDHSPSTPGLKCLNYGKNRGNFLKAWGGIASNQFGLSLFWTNCAQHGLTVKDIHRLMCQNQAKLCGLDNIKGKIAEGYDADFCVWDPDEEFSVTPDIIFFKNKANPYMDMKLRGVVYATIVRGLHVYQQYESFGQPLGKTILQRTSKKLVKFN